jgi:putative flippase GtrA
MSIDGPKSGLAYMLVGVLSVILSVLTLVLAVTHSPLAIATGLLAALCAFSLPRIARRGGARP